MKRSNYVLKIDSPCAESWDNMRPTDSGRFCASCAKNVIDFTHLSDDQILAILKKPGGNQCGRFGEGQMNRYLISSTEHSNRSHLYKFFAGLFLLTATSHSLAKNGVEKIETIEQRGKFSSDLRKFSAVKPEQSLSDSLIGIIKGRVIDSLDQIPLPGALITLKDGNIETVANQDGNFELTIPSNLLKKENTFIVSFVGFETKMFLVNIDEFPIEKNIVLDADILLEMEGVVLGGFEVRKRKWWQFWRKKYCD